MTKISVIVPVYNAEKYLERCIKSLLCQDYKPFEILLINDGSTDSSAQICDNYASHYPFIKVIHQPNTGASIARKNGINAAEGEYIMFVDSDDFVAPCYISTLYSALKTYGTDIAVGLVSRIEEGEKPHSPQFNEEAKLVTQDVLMKRFFKYEFWAFYGICYKKDLFKDVIFPEATIYEDYYVNAQIFIKQKQVAFIPTILYYYEQHPGSLSKQSISLRALGEFDNAYASWEYIKKYRPAYKSNALPIVAESACKLLGMIRRSPNALFNTYKRRIRKFVLKNCVTILLNKHLLYKVKLVLVRNLL